MDPFTLALGGVGLLGGVLGSIFDSRSPSDYYTPVNLWKSPNLATSGYNYGSGRLFQSAQALPAQYMAGGRQYLDEAQRQSMALAQKMVASARPTMASFRGYASSGGAPTGISNVIAASREKAARAASGEQMSNISQQLQSTYQRSLADLWAQGQQLGAQRYGMAQSAYEKEQGQGYQADWQNKMNYMQNYNQEKTFNAQMRMGASQAADAYKSPWTTTGFGLLGMAAGNQFALNQSQQLAGLWGKQDQSGYGNLYNLTPYGDKFTKEFTAMNSLPWGFW